MKRGRRHASQLFATLAALTVFIGGQAPLSAEHPDLEKLRGLQQKMAVAVEKCSPACVSISDGVGFGSGVIVDPQGTILTAGHVVNGGAEYFDVYLASGRKTRAQLLGYNLSVDAGMIRIVDPGPWPHVSVAPKNQLQPGDWTLCLGHSGGFELGRKPPVRSGRLLEYRQHLLITDAVLIGGDSGGPLFDIDGRLVAIHSSIGDSIAENRHVSIETFHTHWERMARREKIGELPELNAATPAPPASTPPALATSENKLGVSLQPGTGRPRITAIAAGSPAERVGIRAGDLIAAVDGVVATSAEQVLTHLQRKPSGQTLAIDIERNGRVLKLQVILDRLK